MRRFVLSLVAVVMLFVLASSSSALAFPDHSFTATLDGSQEVPPRTTNASGRATFAVNMGHSRINFALQVFNIQNVVAAHIHCGAVGVNGPVGVTLFTGSFSGNGNLAHGKILAPDPGNGCGWADVAAVVAAMQSGNTYVNVHTNDGIAPPNTGPGDFPGGEIRGQIQQ